MDTACKTGIVQIHSRRYWYAHTKIDIVSDDWPIFEITENNVSCTLEVEYVRSQLE